MRTILPFTLECGRLTEGPFGSPNGAGPWGAFRIMSPNGKDVLRIIASNGEDAVAESWEHVSVSLEHRCPTWDEMAYVKDLFWLESETVIQFHPPKALHINCHPFCLHLWRHKHRAVELPPAILIGPNSAATNATATTAAETPAAKPRRT